ncbi:MAG: hypothetical protein HUU38_20730 [Anaerolineales bacterium]|nr:hypothetical protein [Anaerolineales bacterium]
MNGKTKLILFRALVTGLFIGLAMTFLEFRLHQPKGSAPIANIPLVETEGDYVIFPLDYMIDISNAIFIGKVINISPTRWNQDSGEFWIGSSPEQVALQLHNLELDMVQPIVDTLGLSKQVQVIVPTVGDFDANERTVYMKEGDQVLFFALRTEIAWRDGMQTVLRQTNAPLYSYFTLGKDGFYHGLSVDGQVSFSQEDLIKKIAERRALQTSP